jgi:hypothetical protein
VSAGLVIGVLLQSLVQPIIDGPSRPATPPDLR